MTEWEAQIDGLIRPAVARSEVTAEVLVTPGAVARTGALAARLTPFRRALVMADEAGFGAAGPAVTAALEAAGFAVRTLIKPSEPLPSASVEEAEPFRVALADDEGLFPISVGSGVINDLVKYAAFETGRRYLSVATAASMDGYTSAGAPLARGGFKITIPTRAPLALVADLDVIAAAPAEMNGWGYGDLAGKVPAGGDWILADLVGAEAIDDRAWPLVQDNLRGWLQAPDGIARGDRDAVAGLFVGLTAVGFAMEAHGTSRPASGADHQIAHLWEMAGHTHRGRKVSHGAAVAVGAVATLALFDWLLEQDLSHLDPSETAARAPSLAVREAALTQAIRDSRIAEKARVELRAKHADRATQTARLARAVDGWARTRRCLERHLIRLPDMVAMLRRAGAPAFAAEIGIDPAHMLDTMRAAAFIRRRYTILDFLHEAGLTDAAFAAVAPRLVESRVGAYA
jgi:glycerol-1-phosphate dehydrogenase [NAD(P)+]